LCREKQIQTLSGIGRSNDDLIDFPFIHLREWEACTK
jgi:hypothetical protein